MPRGKTNILAQITLILESVMVMLMGLLVGVLLPDSISMQIRLALSRSWIYIEPQNTVYTALALSGFLIIHQYLCWMWLIKASKKQFGETNRLGNIIFIYCCSALILFSVGIIYLHTLAP
jgi:hypothetical protein